MSRPVVLFDGECALCNGAVAALLRIDRHGIFAIAGGNGPAGQALLKQAGVVSNMADKSVVVVDGNQAWVRSDAVFHVLSLMPFPLNLLAVGRVIPHRLRDYAYDQIAKHRRKLKDADQACGVPPQELRERWMQRLITDDSSEPEEFEFRFDPVWRPILALAFGVTRKRSFVRIQDGRFVARFGYFWIDKPMSEVDCVHKTGPYKWYRAIGMRLSGADSGRTFGTSTKGGVCVCFKNKHPQAVTVTVKDVDGLFVRLDKGSPT